MLPIRVDSVGWESNNWGDGCGEKNGPPERAHQSGDDDNTAGAIDFGFGEDPIEQGYRGKEVAEDWAMDATRVTRRVIPGWSIE